MKKTDIILKITAKLQRVKEVTHQELWDLIGKSRAQSYKLIAELTKSKGEVDALLTVEEKTTGKVYALNETYITKHDA